MATEERCVCRHPWDFHNGLGSRPCGYGGCQCRVYVKADAPAPQAPLVAQNLFGEMQAVPQDTGEAS